MLNLEKKIILLLFLFVSVLLITSIHGIITPFILAGVLAYLVNPIVEILNRRFKLPKLGAVIIVYIFLISILAALAANVAIRIADEQDDFARQIFNFRKMIQNQTITLPDWYKPLTGEAITSLNFGSLFTPQRLWPYFSGALSGIGSIFVFLVSMFYFMKEGSLFVGSVLKFFLGFEKDQTKKILNQTNQVLNSYLRGQVLLVLVMASVSWIVLTIMGVKYAFLLAIFTGIAEIIPLIGPIAATTAAAMVAMYDGVSIYKMSPYWEAIVVIIIYFILRQLEDQILIPQVMGRVTKLHPLLILFLVLLGGHLWGVFGMILAVPIAAIARIFLISSFADNSNQQK
jgi:predicted PurR-regulated permease PerM